MISFTTVATPGKPYLVREGHETVTVTGPRVHNRAFNHSVRVYPDGKVKLSAQPSVIALHAIGAPRAHLGEVAMGDTVLVDGAPYVITPEIGSDPILVPVVGA